MFLWCQIQNRSKQKPAWTNWCASEKPSGFKSAVGETQKVGCKQTAESSSKSSLTLLGSCGQPRNRDYLPYSYRDITEQMATCPKHTKRLSSWNWSQEKSAKSKNLNLKCDPFYPSCLVLMGTPPIVPNTKVSAWSAGSLTLNWNHHGKPAREEGIRSSLYANVAFTMLPLSVRHENRSQKSLWRWNIARNSTSRQLLSPNQSDPAPNKNADQSTTKHRAPSPCRTCSFWRQWNECARRGLGQTAPTYLRTSFNTRGIASFGPLVPHPQREVMPVSWGRYEEPVNQHHE